MTAELPAALAAPAKLDSTVAPAVRPTQQQGGLASTIVPPQAGLQREPPAAKGPSLASLCRLARLGVAGYVNFT